MSDGNRVDAGALCEPFNATTYDDRWPTEPPPARYGWFSDPHNGGHRKADLVLGAWGLAGCGAAAMGWFPVAGLLVGSLLLTVLIGGVAVLIGLSTRRT